MTGRGGGSDRSSPAAPAPRRAARPRRSGVAAPETPQATTGEIHQRDGHRCARCGQRSQSVQHRIHGDRTDNRASNLVALCGDGTQGCHGWCESHRRDARTLGWEVSKYRRQDTTEITVYYVNHPLSPGRPAWIRLRDDLTAELAEYA